MAHPVETLHPDYAVHHKLCEMIDDACAGQHVVKQKKTKYLPKPNAFSASSGNSKDDNKRYEEYLLRANFIGISGETVAKLTGLPFQNIPELKLPEELAHLEKNSDGKGHSIFQVSQRAVRNILKHYRVGFYVDYPAVGSNGKVRTVAEQKALNLKPRIHCIDSVNIRHHDTTIINGEEKLWLVVLYEEVSSIGADGFSISKKPQWRVLRLVDGIYTIQVFTKNEKGEVTAAQAYTPRDFKGNSWTEIPFIFCNSTDLSPEFGTPAMTEIVNCNFSHYRNNADEEETAFLCGQIVATMPELDAKKAEEIKKSGGLEIGSRGAIATKVEFVQASANTLIGAVADKKLAIMEKLGAVMIQEGSANKTATQSNNESAIQHSVLSLIVSNVSEAIQICLGWAEKFSSNKELGPDELFFAISQDFTKPQFSNEKAKRIWDACVMGVLPFAAWYSYEQNLKFPEMTWAEIEAALEEQNAKNPTAGAGYVPNGGEDE